MFSFKIDIYNGEMRNVANVLQAMSNYFDIKAPAIVNQDGSVLLYLSQQYFYRTNGAMFPIDSILDHPGDFYTVNGELICTRQELNVALRAVPQNHITVDEYHMYRGLPSEATKIIKYIVLDYYSTVRAYEVSEAYKATISFLRPEYKKLVSNCNSAFDDFICGIYSLINTAYPGLLSCLTELGATEDTAYLVLEASNCGDILVVRSTGDWRIEQWKLHLKDKAKASEVRARPENTTGSDIVDVFINSKRVREEKEQAVGDYSFKHLTNFSRL